MLQHSVTFDRMVVIKSKLSGYYFKDFGIWTSRADEAVMFPSEWLARDFMRREHIEDVRVAECELTRELKMAA